LVDGERRLRAALQTNQETIPAHVASGDSPLDDLVTAFHIHMLRKQWQPIAMARALKRIKQILTIKGKATDDAELLEELQARTGCNESKLKALRRAIRFPDTVLEAAAKGDFAWSYLVQIEESVLEHLDDFPEVLKTVSKPKARQVLVEKAKRGVLSSTRILIDCVAPVMARAKTTDQKTKATAILKKFLTDVDMGAEAVLSEYEGAFPDSGANMIEVVKGILTASVTLTSQLRSVGANLVAEHPQLARDLRRTLQELRTETARSLRRIGRG